MIQGRNGDMKIKFGFVILFLFSSAILSPLFAQQAAQDRISEKLLKEKPIDKCLISRVEIYNPFEARRDSLIDFFANRPTGGYIDIAAKLFSGHDVDWALAKLDTLMQNPQGDMFWMYPFITVTYAGKNRIPIEMKQKMRDLWRTYTPYRGDTENHWAMYYTALYLITQMYPDEPGESWYNGRSSEENHNEAGEYLISWMDLTTTLGQGEFDSPDYYGVYIVPMAQLFAFAEDPKMKQRAAMMLDYLIADFAAENLDGMWMGGHSRTYPEPVLNQWKTSAAGISWLLFGNTPYQARGEAVILAMSGYEPPEILYYIATDRSQPYVHKELKRTRHRIRHSEVRNAPVYKYTYMRKEYAIGSLQGGLLQPIQQHTWDVTWAIDYPREGFNTLFTLHPYSSGYELSMYFPEETKLMIQGVTKSKNTYDSWDKWTSASPYEQVFQHQDALIALYNIPKGTRFEHIDGFFPKSLDKREIDASGWIFCQGGKAYIAYYPLAKYKWMEEDNNWRLHSKVLKNGAIVQVAPADEFESFDAFKTKIRALKLSKKIEPKPQVSFTTLNDDVMEFAFGDTPKLNGTPVDYESWKLFDGPFLHAEKGSRMLEMRYGPMHRLLDFNNLKIKEWVE
jgi:hypothetical protein